MASSKFFWLAAGAACLVAVLLLAPEARAALTTAEPATAAPTTAEPATAAPTTAEPATAAPTTAAPTTVGPAKSGNKTAEINRNGQILDFKKTIERLDWLLPYMSDPSVPFSDRYLMRMPVGDIIECMLLTSNPRPLDKMIRPYHCCIIEPVRRSLSSLCGGVPPKPRPRPVPDLPPSISTTRKTKLRPPSKVWPTRRPLPPPKPKTTALAAKSTAKPDSESAGSAPSPTRKPRKKRLRKSGHRSKSSRASLDKAAELIVEVSTAAPASAIISTTGDTGDTTTASPEDS